MSYNGGFKRGPTARVGLYYQATVNNPENINNENPDALFVPAELHMVRSAKLFTNRKKGCQYLLWECRSPITYNAAAVMVKPGIYVSNVRCPDPDLDYKLYQASLFALAQAHGGEYPLQRRPLGHVEVRKRDAKTRDIGCFGSCEAPCGTASCKSENHVRDRSPRPREPIRHESEPVTPREHDDDRERRSRAKRSVYERDDGRRESSEESQP